MKISTVISLLILVLLSAGLASCDLKGFKQTRAETQDAQKERKAQYAADAEEKRLRDEAEKEALIRQIEAERLAEEASQSEPVTEAAPVPPPVFQVDSILLQFERRPCFGRCEVYKIKIYESGYTTYEGVNFVQNMGYYSARLSPAEIAKVYTMVAESDFFNLADRYDNEQVTDLASMIFKVRAMGQEKRIIARYDIPEVLIKMGRDIDAMFAETQWQSAKP